MESKNAKGGRGAFHWNAGGWFGAQIGGTFWLLLAGALFLLQQDMIAGITLIICFLALNIVGVFMWYHRDGIAPYPAIQVLIAFIGGLSFIAITVLDIAGQLPSGTTGTEYTRWFLIFPAVMLFFYLQERSSRKKEE